MITWILLDVTNLLINATNFSYDPYYYLNNIPRDRIKQLHIAGYKKIYNQLFDSHSGGIDEYLIQLTEWILSKTSCKAIVIERDSDYNTFNDLLDDITICRNLLKKYL
ncbi:DUF692 family multinuclear iron-containing protein [Hazenella coriacea]|uniref:multinuclear nonheme iron-dependent oxidase n=1 Tax=Hazenella coriacea TaxID=1179467 RepID=UPI00104C9A68